ncbi:hypothetical protein [Salinispora cortesiana]|uniref:hypothetical protein n=1 Tax=Salinispora cortesiana TaxID=1305843 RepID=UPI00040C6FBF|nr:hypothetical protein [Salinispora cortesiana]
MSHDLIAEMQAYRDERSRYAREGRAERAAAVGAELARVVAAIGVEADKLDAKAAGHADDGQDVLAAQARIAAKRLRATVAEVGELENTAGGESSRKRSTRR